MSPEVREPLKELGVDHVILTNSGKEDFDREVLEITEGRGVDVAVDFVSLAETLESAVRCLAPSGRMVTVGVHRGKGFTLDPKTVLRKELTITGSRALSRMEVKDGVGILTRGMVKPILTGSYPLEKANEVMEMDMDNKIVGRAVLLP